MSNSLQLETENEDECEKGTVPPGKIEDECEKGTVPPGKISEPGKIGL
jgi:hypothetical protein